MEMTAMQELFERFGHLLPNIEKQFLEKEKEDIMNAYTDGFANGLAADGKQLVLTSSKYYSQTFNPLSTI